MITTPEADPALIEDLVAANRILYDQGVVDGFGHVSLRHDKRPEHFLLARSMEPGLADALRLGQGRVTFLSEAEAKASTETNRAQIGRPWELWKAQALAR